MRSRKLRWVVTGLAVPMLIVLTAWLRPQPSSPVTWPNCERIRKGMSLAEIEEILGPPGDSRTAPFIYIEIPHVITWSAPHEPSGTEYEWQGDSMRIAIEFSGPDARASRLTHWSRCRGAPGEMYTLIWRAKRQFQRWFP
jgi:hypothetical protein